eukprot:1770132-Lingulodinium_polyedra.AAC.1
MPATPAEERTMDGITRCASASTSTKKTRPLHVGGRRPTAPWHKAKDAAPTRGREANRGGISNRRVAGNLAEGRH